MRTVIVGGGACGASAAARLRRLDEKAEIIILEATEEVSIANCGLPYYCSDVICDRDKVIIAKPSVFIDTLNIDLRFKSRVTSLDRQKKVVRVNDEYDLSYDKLILSMGAAPIKPPIEGIDNKKVFTVRTLANADSIKDFAKTNGIKNAVVIGAGFVGVEMAENFVEMGLNTTLVELAPQILAPVDEEIAAFGQNEMRNNGCNLILNNGVKRFGEDEIELNNGDKLPYDIAILAIGVRPGTAIAKEAGLELGLNGSLKVDEYMQTSDPNIYAGGDSVEIVDFVLQQPGLVPLAGPANRQGRIIADNICGRKQTYKASQGTAAIKIFDKTIASVGKNERQLKNLGIDYLKNIIQSTSHSGYYPDAAPLFLKLLFTKEGKILGAQAVGTNGTEKRIDVIATVMRLNGTVQDLIDAELCYAPPYSSAKDAVNMIGMSSMNIIEGLHRPAFVEDFKSSFILDIRPKPVRDFRPIEGALAIPAEELRDRLDEIPRDKKVVITCQKGFNSYTANRVLMQSGFTNTYSLAGGLYIVDELEKDKNGLVCPLILRPKKEETALDGVIKLDLSGVQCPGPIMKLSETIKASEVGQEIEITTTDSGFAADIDAWCKGTGNELLNVKKEGIRVIARVKKGEKPVAPAVGTVPAMNGQTLVVFSNELDKALAALIIANGARASGKEVTMFFTFWGINILRKPEYNAANKGLMDKMFGMMMPKGTDKLKLSKMNMGGMGTAMMKMVMKNKNVLSLDELIKQALASGIKIIACTMAMDIMGIREEELIDGVEFGGVAKYIAESNNANSNLFI
jgi:NADPH-dependent 2,4-dienoyl-CoA reductase/sulfur reductase-like enzyme/peroxiredoxin family protein/TusA-related sulfurtransferase/rhodanese-related sulfurtransferase